MPIPSDSKTERFVLIFKDESEICFGSHEECVDAQDRIAFAGSTTIMRETIERKLVSYKP